MHREPKLGVDLGRRALSLPAERRDQPRQTERGTARCSITTPAGSSKLTIVELRDSSPGGLGVRSAVPADAGSLVEIFPFAEPIPMTHAEVVRCEPDPEGGFRLGLRLRRRVRVAS